MEKSKWQTYYENTRTKPHSKYLEKSLKYVKSKDAALDLGAGGLMDSAFLVQSGFKYVEAVDAEPAVADIGKKMGNEKINIIVSRFEDFDFKHEQYDLVHARVSLPFIAPENFDDVIEKIKKSLKPEGVLVADFFGNNDGWVGREGVTCVTKKELEFLLQGMNILSFDETEGDGTTAAGEPKHWHIFHITAQKPE